MDKTKIAHGLSILVQSTSFTHRVNQINEIVAGWEDTPLLFGGALEPLNALVDVGLHNKEALAKLVELARQKRRAVPTSRRVDYQRELMREKRERLYKAVELEELVRGAPLKGAAKSKYMAGVQSKWMQERNAFIAAKGNLTWKQRNEAASAFWQQVDGKLEADLAESQKSLSKSKKTR